MTSKDLATAILIAFAVLLLLTWTVSIVEVVMRKRIEHKFRKRMYEIELKREERKASGG